MSEQPPLLSVLALAVHHRGQARPALAGVSFDLAPAGTLTVVGASGAGKSTLLAAICGLLPPTARVTGSVRLAGGELVGAREAVLRRVRGGQIGLVFQDALGALDPTMPVGRQVAEAAALHLGLGGAAAAAAATAALDRVGLPDPARLARAYPHELSGGMRQRVLLAAALSGGPRLLLLDEPTAALDAGAAQALCDLLLSLQASMGLGLLLVTHDIRLARRAGGRLGVMYAGSLVEEGPVATVLDGPAHPYTAALLAALPEHGLHPLPDRRPGPAAPSWGCSFAPTCPRVLARCTTEAPPAFAPQVGRLARCWLHAPGEPGGGRA